jgi:hypothetical protein
MTRDQWIQRIHEGKVNIFGDIPKKHQDVEIVFHWVASGQGHLREVPLHLVTDDIRIEAMAPRNKGLTTYSLVAIKPSHTERYEEIALLGMKANARNLWVVDKNFHNNDFMKKALMVNGDALLPLFDEDARLDAMDIEITQDLIDLAVSRSASYFGKFKSSQFSPHAVRECIKNCEMDYQRLVDIGQFDALVDVIKTGWWGDHLPEKPRNLSHCAVQLLSDHEDKLVYRAYAKTFPIPDVIAFLAGPTLRQEVFEMYTAKELAPFLKEGPLSEDKAFKGRLLESELGL